MRPPAAVIPEMDDDSTQVEVPMMDEEEDSSYKLHDDDHGKTNVVLFADEDEEDDEPIAPVAKKKGRPDDSFALQESGVEFAEAEDFSDDEDLEVAADVLTEEEGTSTRSMFSNRPRKTSTAASNRAKATPNSSPLSPCGPPSRSKPRGTG